jgi:hypothetical protein
MAAPRVCFALPTLFDAVIARFEADGTKADNLFGWREPSKWKQSSVPRVVWVPGGDGEDAGEIRAARNPGANPRSIATLGELFTAHITGSDPQFPEDERKQYEATRLLFDAWYRAVYKAAHGTFSVASLSWNVSKNERRNGTELVCVCELEAMIPDLPVVFAPTDAEAEITTSLEDVDEITVTA